MREYVRTFGKYYIAGTLLAAAIFIWYAVARESRSGLLVAFLDVGQGDSIFIEAPDGSQMLVDGGSGKQVLRALGGVMPFYDRSIDVVIGTHTDADHIGGLPGVFNRFKVAAYIDPGVSSRTGVYQNLEASIAKESGLVRVAARRGMVVALATSTALTILFPDRDMSGADPNDTSIVARLDYGDTSFLLTGDSPKKIERYLISLDKNSVDVDVLKLGHHGSKTSTSEELLGWASPEYAIVSAGKNNRYGHPHKEVIDMLKRFDIPVLRTDDSGTIRIRSDGKSIDVEGN